MPSERCSARGEAQGDEVGYSFWRSGGVVQFFKLIVAVISEKPQGYLSASKSDPSPTLVPRAPSPLGRGKEPASIPLRIVSFFLANISRAM